MSNELNSLKVSEIRKKLMTYDLTKDSAATELNCHKEKAQPGTKALMIQTIQIQQ